MATGLPLPVETTQDTTTDCEKILPQNNFLWYLRMHAMLMQTFNKLRKLAFYRL